MFNNVLVAEDMDDINKGVLFKLKELNIKNIDQVQYCDDAYLKIKKAYIDQSPFDLLITDLSFKTDYREQKFNSGEELIKVLNTEFPELKIIIYSVEDRTQKVRSLLNNLKINAFVCKGRKGLVELGDAVISITENKKYLSPQINDALNDNNNLELDDYDIELVRLLSRGMSQEEISNHFKNWKINPSGLSSIEKRLNKLRIDFKANNAIHLVAVFKDLGLI